MTVPAKQAVVHVSGGASEDQRQGYFEHRRFFDGWAEKHGSDDCHYSQRYAYQKDCCAIRCETPIGIRTPRRDFPRGRY